MDEPERGGRAEFGWDETDTREARKFSEWYARQDTIAVYDDYGEFMRDLDENRAPMPDRCNPPAGPQQRALPSRRS